METQMIRTAEHHEWCAFYTHNDCCGKECDCGAHEVNTSIIKLRSLLWEVASAPRVYTVDEEHIAAFIPIKAAREIEDIVGYDEMGQ